MRSNTLRPNLESWVLLGKSPALVTRNNYQQVEEHIGLLYPHPVPSASRLIDVFYWQLSPSDMQEYAPKAFFYQNNEIVDGPVVDVIIPCRPGVTGWTKPL